MYEAYISGHGWMKLNSETYEDAQAASKSIGAVRVRVVGELDPHVNYGDRDFEFRNPEE